MVIEYLILLLIVLLPYSIIGEEFGSLILLTLGCLYLIINKKEIKINNTYFYSLIAITLTGIFSLIFTRNLTRSLGGLSIYINGIIFYLIFSKRDIKKENIIKFIICLAAISAIISVAFQGVILKQRIDGNFGYANTYALFLLICLYLCEILHEKAYLKTFFDFIFMLGILYTGSRNTFAYLTVFIALKLYSERKKSEKFSSLLSLFLSIAVYLIFQHAGFGMVLLMPIILYTAYVIFKNLSYKIKNIMVLIMGAGSLSLFFIFRTNLLNRLYNMNLNSGVLQERFVYFEDVLRQTLINPLGNGINTFEYKQYITQSAFYDVRFVHNSILQSLYDMGIPGAAAFIAAAAVGLYIIIKSKSEHKRFILPAFLTIYLHSLLDFDFSYAPIMIITVMLIAFSYNEIKTKENTVVHFKPLVCTASIILIMSCWLVSVNSLYCIGDHLLNLKNAQAARICFNINRFITVKDPDCYSKLAESYIPESDKDEVIKNLQTANKINPYDPRIIGNLAFINQQTGNTENAIKYYDEFLTKERFYPDMYLAYNKFLQQKYEETKDITYENKRKELSNIYKLNLSKLNPKSKYMNNQLSQNNLTI